MGDRGLFPGSEGAVHDQGSVSDPLHVLLNGENNPGVARVLYSGPLFRQYIPGKQGDIVTFLLLFETLILVQVVLATGAVFIVSH